MKTLLMYTLFLIDLVTIVSSTYIRNRGNNREIIRSLLYFTIFMLSQNGIFKFMDPFDMLRFVICFCAFMLVSVLSAVEAYVIYKNKKEKAKHDQ